MESANYESLSQTLNNLHGRLNKMLLHNDECFSTNTMSMRATYLNMIHGVMEAAQNLLVKEEYDKLCQYRESLVEVKVRYYR